MTKRTLPIFPPEGLQFLRSLKRNNNRDWFNQRKTAYEATIREPMQKIIDALAEDFARFAPEMLATKKSLYRIYRDTRFSKDKSPYKTHVAASFPRSGLPKHEGAGLYFHISSEDVLVGGGLHMPTPDDLRAVRSHIAENFKSFQGIVNNRRFKKIFGDVHGERLSRIPTGFPSDHPAGEYLKLKQFLAAKTFAPDDSVQPRFYKDLVETFEAAIPFIRFINEPILQAQRIRDRQKAVLR